MTPQENPQENEARLDVSEKLTADRLASIDEARRALRQYRRETKMHEFSHQLTPQMANVIYRTTLESFLHEIEPYKDLDEKAKAFWAGPEDVVLGQVTISPPPLDDDKWWDRGKPRDLDRQVDDSHLPEGPEVIYVVRGLNDLLTAPETFRKEYTVTVSHRHSPSKEHTVEVEQVLPRPVLDTASRWAREYCRYIGLDLDLDKTAGATWDV